MRYTAVDQIMECFGDCLESKIRRMPIPKEEVDVGAGTKLDRTYGMSRTSTQGTSKASASCYRYIGIFSKYKDICLLPRLLKADAKGWKAIDSAEGSNCRPRLQGSDVLLSRCRRSAGNCRQINIKLWEKQVHGTLTAG